MDLFGSTIRTLENSLDYASTKNRVISNNIANVDTPNYKAKDVVFKNILDDAIQSNLEAKKTNDKHLSFHSESNSTYRVITKNNTIYNHNGNNVDIDKQMSDLAKNQIYYNSLVDRMNGKFNSLRTVIRGGN
ncbi:flagellar basal body rod protein FlgB [Oceanobacillus caeni]|uniref:flagellar basal body rod protein FlgB n=1 Tax=Bacillaceae TaxID=186817 RepID=UPI0006213BF2|nr:flagellar basal body rod protein FlgB [Virgibacillus sp. SK37]KKE78366.1 flagellar basal body rod protein FlgB [Bacilli bacterium VT-13-104]MBU8790099.1 flagellar basal body rod protein FlgB [Oceanobacillus caeni]PZD88678.1 flagellar basal body rod protein FlgB [Bacilli bacterium]MCR1833258.1 flagellar basal body rod protein FlgB [Oceanobacillus caeni]PZD89970.1 flagellar basal body rod protein FlgB [Bacilli bacterium]